MKKSINISLFLILFLVSKPLCAQQSIKIITHYPTQGQSDGSLKINVSGYPNNVSFTLHPFTATMNPNVNIIGNDSIVNLSFTESLIMYCKDLNTQDTISEVVLDLGSSWLDSLIINTVSPNTISSCDGSINAEVYLKPTFIDNLIYTLDPNVNGTIDDTISSANQSWANLCQGNSNSLDIFTNTGSLLFQYGIMLIPLNYGSTPSFDIEIATSPSTLNCNGEAFSNVLGGSSPYLYSFNQASFDNMQNAGDLCPGIHNLRVVDNNQDTLGINFGIPNYTNIYQDPLLFGVVDSVYFNTENCQFDYNTSVDSIFITSLIEVDQTTLIMTSEIWQSGLSTVNTDTINVDYSLTGPNLISITYFCGAKSMEKLVYQMVTMASVNGTAGLSSSEQFYKNFEIYPNPTQSEINVKGQWNKSSNYRIEDMQGRIVISGKLNTSEEKIDLSTLKPGTYIFKLNDSRRKIIKL